MVILSLLLASTNFWHIFLMIFKTKFNKDNYGLEQELLLNIRGAATFFS